MLIVVHSAATATTALFADLFGSLTDLMIDFFQLIERFHHYLISQGQHSPAR